MLRPKKSFFLPPRHSLEIIVYIFYSLKLTDISDMSVFQTFQTPGAVSQWGTKVTRSSEELILWGQKKAKQTKTWRSSSFSAPCTEMVKPADLAAVPFLSVGAKVFTLCMRNKQRRVLKLLYSTKCISYWVLNNKKDPFPASDSLWCMDLRCFGAN